MSNFYEAVKKVSAFMLLKNYCLNEIMVSLIKVWSSAKWSVDFRSDWALCCWRFAFAQLKHLLLLTLRFRTDKKFVAAATKIKNIRHEHSIAAVVSC